MYTVLIGDFYSGGFKVRIVCGCYIVNFVPNAIVFLSLRQIKRFVVTRMISLLTVLISKLNPLLESNLAEADRCIAN